MHAYIQWQAPGLMIVWRISYITGDILHDIKLLTQTCAAASLLRREYQQKSEPGWRGIEQDGYLVLERMVVAAKKNRETRLIDETMANV